jgi:MFS family permease
MNATPPADASRPAALKLTRTQWLICFIAAMGFAFDIYELLMLPLIVRPALLELGGLQPGTPEFAAWVGRLFYIPAIAGGVFGLLGGYLTDRLGRRRVLTFSILLYAFSAFFAGFSTSLGMLLVFRCLVFIGVCVEFVAAVAWLAELFDDPKQRERVLGYTQAFSSIGGLLVAVANGLAVSYAASFPGIGLPGFLEGALGTVKEPHAAWRYTLMSGLVPALPLVVIRPFLPESPKWQQKKAAGTLKRPSLAELFAPQLRKTTLVTTVMFACSFGAAFGAIQQIQQIIPGLPEVKADVARRLEQEDARKAVEKHLASPAVQALVKDKPEDEQKKILAQEKAKAGRRFTGPVEQTTAANVTKVQEVGGLVGRVLLAVLATVILSRAKLIRVFLVPGLFIMPLVFGYAAVKDLSLLYGGMFLAGLLTVGQFSFWGNYLPRVYPVHLRGTGESFAANIGGRLIGTSFAWLTQTVAVMGFVPGASPAAKLAYTAAAVALFVYVANLVLSFFLTEPGGDKLME